MKMDDDEGRAGHVIQRHKTNVAGEVRGVYREMYVGDGGDFDI